MGFQEIFYLIIGIFLLIVGIITVVKRKPAKIVILTFVYGAIIIIYAFFTNVISYWIFFGALILFGVIISSVSQKKTN